MNKMRNKTLDGGFVSKAIRGFELPYRRPKDGRRTKEKAALKISSTRFVFVNAFD
jgi:hypothetical protein